MSNQEPDLIETMEAVFGKENVFVIDESFKFEQEDPMEHDEQWVHVARRWTAIWDEVPFPSIGADEADAKAKSQLYDEMHYNAFRDEFPAWDFRHFECSRQPNLTDDVLLELWTEDDDEPTYWIHMEASEDAPFWLINTFTPAKFQAETKIYTFND